MARTQGPAGGTVVFVSHTKSKLLSLGRSRGKSRHETK